MAERVVTGHCNALDRTAGFVLLGTPLVPAHDVAIVGRRDRHFRRRVVHLIHGDGSSAWTCE
jgi:hypothetical protein